MRPRDEHGRLSTVPLLDAVLCVDCETISSSPHDVCVVCGSRSLMNLHRLLEGTLSCGSVGDTPKYNLEIKARVRGFSAQELSQTAESLIRILGSKHTAGWEELHFEVVPATETDENTQAIAA